MVADLHFKPGPAGKAMLESTAVKLRIMASNPTSEESLRKSRRLNSRGTLSVDERYKALLIWSHDRLTTENADHYAFMLLPPSHLFFFLFPFSGLTAGAPCKGSAWLVSVSIIFAFYILAVVMQYSFQTVHVRSTELGWNTVHAFLKRVLRMEKETELVTRGIDTEWHISVPERGGEWLFVFSSIFQDIRYLSEEYIGVPYA